MELSHALIELLTGKFRSHITNCLFVLEGAADMSNIIPIRSISRADVDEPAVADQLEQIPGELDLDRVIKTQLSAAPVVERITHLEDCLGVIAQELLRFDPRSALAERAKLLLKDRIEIQGCEGHAGPR